MIINSQVVYPERTEYFSPDQMFPEYVHKHISKQPNTVYSMVRESFVQADLDVENYGKSCWNPLGKIIKPGSKVFVLCNFVYHRRKDESEKDFFSKCTHGSMLRAVVDYILIAVGADGLVRFGNAPLQSCEWSRVLFDTGASRVVEFYKSFTSSRIEACDLRSYITRRDALGRVIFVSEENDNSQVRVDLGENSLLEELYIGEIKPIFRVTDYDCDGGQNFHADKKHIYIINQKILDSDVIMSIPKMKTHEKVGITLGIKGCVGAVARKECLAHHRYGTPSIGGDEYRSNMFHLNWLSSFHDYLNRMKQNTYANMLRMVEKSIRTLLRECGFIQAGAWHGNDTAWRMSVDIARIVKYCDNNGQMSNKERRQHLLLIDGIVGGDHEGPLNPEPVDSKTILLSSNIVMGDYYGAMLMGFDPMRFPIIKECFRIASYPLLDDVLPETKCIVNGRNVQCGELQGMLKKTYVPSKGWQN